MNIIQPSQQRDGFLFQKLFRNIKNRGNKIKPNVYKGVKQKITLKQ